MWTCNQMKKRKKRTRFALATMPLQQCLLSVQLHFNFDERGKEGNCWERMKRKKTENSLYDVTDPSNERKIHFVEEERSLFVERAAIVRTYRKHTETERCKISVVLVWMPTTSMCVFSLCVCRRFSSFRISYVFSTRRFSCRFFAQMHCHC